MTAQVSAESHPGCSSHAGIPQASILFPLHFPPAPGVPVHSHSFYITLSADGSKSLPLPLTSAPRRGGGLEIQLSSWTSPVMSSSALPNAAHHLSLSPPWCLLHSPPSDKAAVTSTDHTEDAWRPGWLGRLPKNPLSSASLHPGLQCL